MRLLSYADVAQMLSVSTDTVKRLWKLKKVIPPPHKLEGIGWRWWEDEIMSYLYLERARRQAQIGKKPDP